MVQRAGLPITNLDKEVTEAETTKKGSLIYYMGGGTFDVSILDIQDTVFEVKATAGDPHLGGEYFDNLLLIHCTGEFQCRYKEDPTRNQRALRRLRTQCERAKRQLSTQTSVTLEVDSFVAQRERLQPPAVAGKVRGAEHGLLQEGHGARDPAPGGCQV